MAKYRVIHTIKYKGIEYKDGQVVDFDEETALKVNFAVVKQPENEDKKKNLKKD